MHRKLEQRVGATRAAWLRLSSLFVRAWDRVAGVSKWPKPLADSHIDNDEPLGNPRGGIGIKSCLTPFISFTWHGSAVELYGGNGNDYLHIGDPDPANDGGASSLSRIPSNNRSYADGGDGNDTPTVVRYYSPIAIAVVRNYSEWRIAA